MTLEPVLLRVGDAPDIAGFLADRIYEFNAETTGYFDGESFYATRQDAAGTIRAGIYGYTWGGCGYVSQLWVDAAERGQGTGSALLRAAEAHATARGCRIMFLATHNFQAPAFYERLGYTRQSVLQDHPVGHTSLIFAKRLRES